MGSMRINLTRLLRSCEMLAADGLQDRADRRKFEKYLTVLGRLWVDLTHQPNVPDAVLTEYRRQIERLAELLDSDKLLINAGSSLALTQVSSNSSLTREQAIAELSGRLQTRSCVQEALRSQLFDGTPSAQAGGSVSIAAASSSAPGADAAASSASGALDAGGASELLGRRGGAAAQRVGRRRGGEVEEEALSKTLAEEREMHDLVIGQLTHAVGELRDRTLHVRQAVRDDVAVLDATSKTLDNNQGALRDNNARLAARFKAMRSSTCTTCFLILAVCAIFVCTVLLMKIVPKAQQPHLQPQQPHPQSQ